MYELTESWGYALGKITQSMSDSFCTHLAKYDINARDYGVLSIVRSNPGVTQKKIGELMSVDRTTMVQLIDALEAKGLLTRSSNPQDRRQNLITATDKGADILDDMWDVLKDGEQQTVKTLPGYQKKAILDIARLLEKEEP